MNNSEVTVTVRFSFSVAFEDSLLPFSQLLHLVGLGLRRTLHSGDELLFSAINLLLLNCDLFFSLHHLNFNLLQTDLLLLFGRLQLICQLSFCFLGRQGFIYFLNIQCSCLWKIQQMQSHKFQCDTFVFTSWLKEAFCISSSRLESAIFVSARNLISIISFLHSAS